MLHTVLIQLDDGDIDIIDKIMQLFKKRMFRIWQTIGYLQPRIGKKNVIPQYVS